MSRLRTNPKHRTCQQWLGLGERVELPTDRPTKTTKHGTFIDRGTCEEPAVIRCNACKEYFCEECWTDHLEMTVVREETK